MLGGRIMRLFDTNVQALKYDVLKEVAKLAFEDNLEGGMLDISKKIVPGPEPSIRCCIYKERAILNERIKLAMGGNENNPNVNNNRPIPLTISTI